MTTTPRARYGPSASSSSASAARRCGPASPRAAPVVSPLSVAAGRPRAARRRRAARAARSRSRACARAKAPGLPVPRRRGARASARALPRRAPARRLAPSACAARVAKWLSCSTRSELGISSGGNTSSSRPKGGSPSCCVTDQRVPSCRTPTVGARRPRSAAPTAPSSSGVPSGRSRHSATRSAPESSRARRRTCVELWAVSEPAASASAATRSGDSGLPSSRSSASKARAARPTCAATSRAAVRALSSKPPRDPEELDTPVHLATHDDGHDERTLRPQALGQTCHGLRRLAESRPRPLAARRAASARPRARRRPPRTGLQPPARPARGGPRRRCGRGRRRPP